VGPNVILSVCFPFIFKGCISLGTCGRCGSVISSNSPNGILQGISSAIACQNNCAAQSDCYYWQYDATLECKLFGGLHIQLPVLDPTAISGPKHC
jgi:hypothetical protein